MANNPPDAEFLLTVAKEQLSRHLSPLVFQYFEWSISDDPFNDRWVLRGESHSRVALKTPLQTVREFEAMDVAELAQKVEYYHPKPFHIHMAFEKHHANAAWLKVAFDETVANMVDKLSFLEKASDIQELEAWLILAQKPT